MVMRASHALRNMYASACAPLRVTTTSLWASWAQNERITWCGASRSQDTLTVAGYGLSLRVSLIIPLIIAHAPIRVSMQ
jgi:hypothetical protein